MARKGGLGKGLEALIPGNASPDANEGTIYVSLDNLIPNPRQPRHHINDETLQELAASIREHGILQPLLVSFEPESGQYILVAGERRLRAARIAGLEAVPILVRQVTEQQRLELALIENVQRSDLTPLETADAYRQLNEEFNLSHEEIATRVGKSRVAITNTLRLLKLPELIRQALAEEKITEGHARALLGLGTPQAQVAALQTVMNQNMTVRQTEELVRKWIRERPAHVIKSVPPPEIREIEERLRIQLGTKVTLRHGKKGGSLIIRYYSDEELDALLSTILKE
jgi:ParB family transcriptional regulator, chromosome partitioning protein